MDNNETLADIVREMRDTCGDIADHEVVDYADRIEAAAQREKVETATIAATKAVNLTDEKWRRDIGNAAALREALEAVRDAFDSNDFGAIGDHPSSEVLDMADAVRRKVDAALRAPARNCDRYRTEDEALKAWDGLDENDAGDWFAFTDWLLAEAEGKEASNG